MGAGKRMAASAAMQHPYFAMEPLPATHADVAIFVRESCSAKEASKRLRSGL